MITTKNIIIGLEATTLIMLVVIAALLISPVEKEKEKIDVPFKKTVVTRQAPDTFKDYRIDGYTSDEIFTYFKEIVNSAEHAETDEIHRLVQKWTVPVYYKIYGTPTQEDIETLNQLFSQLNKIDFFPGIYPADENNPENFNIYFINRNLFNKSFGDIIHGEQANGAAEYWFYVESNKIYSAKIGIVTDTDQATRSSVIVEEVINALGLADTVLREDSVVYQYTSKNTMLSEIDLLVLKLLYHPLIEPGMTAEECKETPLFKY